MYMVEVGVTGTNMVPADDSTLCNKSGASSILAAQIDSTGREAVWTLIWLQLAESIALVVGSAPR
jgi:precorrin isomerase